MIRGATQSDFAAILALNAESVHFLSPLTLERLTQLHESAAYHKVFVVEARVAAFLLAFREGAEYDSPNYVWFAKRYPRFLYIDRVVVHVSHRGQGLGGFLYDDIFEFAQSADVSPLTCEFDLEPPNPASSCFHQRHGFREVGTQWLYGGKKRVSLQARPVAPLSNPS